MNLLLYIAKTDGVAERVERLAEALVSRERTEICRTKESFYQRLCRPVDDLAVSVLLAADKKDLSDMMSMKELIWRLPTILILPDTGEDSIAKAHMLRPTFVSHTDSNFLGVSAVLTRMLENSNDNKTRKSEMG